MSRPNAHAPLKNVDQTASEDDLDGALTQRMLKLITFAFGFVVNSNWAARSDGFAHIRQEQHIIRSCMLSPASFMRLSKGCQGGGTIRACMLS